MRSELMKIIKIHRDLHNKFVKGCGARCWLTVAIKSNTLLLS